MKRYTIILSFLIVVCSHGGFAQISPGELSRSHEKLEGIDNCTNCHEKGEEITGKKCLKCHTEINNAIAEKHGYHFKTSATACISCHKEHLGRDASITQFNKKDFDHKKTGYALNGKHASLACESCHASNRIKDPFVLKKLKQYSRQTYLGLRQQCNDCHADRHGNSLGTSCQNCHTYDAWKPAAAFSHSQTKFQLIGKHERLVCMQCHESFKTRDAARPVLFSIKEYEDCNACHKSPHGEKFSKQACRTCHSPNGWQSVTGFDHSATSFTLTGKHRTVVCEKCHAGLRAKSVGANRDFKTKPFKDCSPCHNSPHANSFSKKLCYSCHTPEQWSSVSEKNFDHTLTSLPLLGKHLLLRCDKCHSKETKQVFNIVFKLTKKFCIDCHEDKHKGQFTQSFGNDCSKCHNEDGFTPSTFSFEEHGKTKFVLANSHLTVPCSGCHNKQTEWIFRFDNTACESCHRDHHMGQFKELMKEQSCEICHTSKSWKTVLFDHAKTSFQLIGQHTSVACSQCHVKGYKGTSTECAYCHNDPHAGQFLDKGKTDCARCHTPIGRRATIFQHNVQSSFVLTGAHTKVECGACHKPEERGGKIVVRYKPLSTKCESCHQGKS